MSNFTQPLCVACWNDDNPDRPAVTVNYGDQEICCKCGHYTWADIYIRINPFSVRFPTIDGKLVVTYPKDYGVWAFDWTYIRWVFYPTWYKEEFGGDICACKECQLTLAELLDRGTPLQYDTKLDPISPNFDINSWEDNK